MISAVTLQIFITPPSFCRVARGLGSGDLRSAISAWEFASSIAEGAERVLQSSAIESKCFLPSMKAYLFMGRQ